MIPNSSRKKSTWFNIVDFDSAIYSIVSKKKLIMRVLGFVDNYPVYLITHNLPNSLRNVLIMAGFHGDEQGGCLGILRYLESMTNVEENINISFIPRVNPTGLVRNARYNRFGEDPNRGFYTHKQKFSTSIEGKLLKENLSEILKLSKDGFLTLHEDVDEISNFYLYSFDRKHKISDIAIKIIQAGRNTISNYEKLPQENQNDVENLLEHF